MNEKKILLADVKSCNVNGSSPGHYFALAQNYLDMWEALLPVEIMGGPVYQGRFSNVFPLPCDELAEANFFKRKLSVMRNCFAALSAAGENILVFQSNAIATIYICLLFYQKKRNIFMIQYNQNSIDSAFKRLIYRAVKRKICGVLCPKQEIGEAYGLPYFVMPDYCVTPATLNALEMPDIPKKYDYAMVGLIVEDKGVTEIAQLLANTDVSVLIAGRPATQELRRELEKICAGCSNIELILRYTSDEEYDRFIRSARYCILNYSDAYSSHSSGVVFDVLYRGVPIVGRSCESLDFVRDNALGYIYQNAADFDFQSLIRRDETEYFRHSIVAYLRSQMDVPKALAAFLEENRRL